MSLSTLQPRASRDSSPSTISASSSLFVILDDSDSDSEFNNEEDFVVIPSSPGESREQPITLDVDENDANIDVYLTNNGDNEEDVLDPNGNFLFDETFDMVEDEPVSDSDECMIMGSTSKPRAALTERTRVASLQDHFSKGYSVKATSPSLGSPKRKRSTSEDLVVISERQLPNAFKRLHIEPLSLRIDQNVELKNGSFLRIKHIAEDCETVSGIVMKRLKKISKLMPNQKHELCWVVDLSGQDYARGVRSELKEYPVSAIAMERTIVMSNIPVSQEDRAYSTKRFQDSSKMATLPTLYCRWKIIRVFKDINRPRSLVEAIYSHLNERAADEVHRAKDAQIRRRFQGQRIAAGGSHVEYVEDPQTVSLLEEDEHHLGTYVVVKRQYTIGDGFSGAGGTTCGAVMADLHPSWGFDHDQDPLSSYEANFDHKGSISVCLPVHKFIEYAKDMTLSNWKVDVLHISPPCQPFSPVHTKAGVNDESNEAALFCIGDLLNAVKPRVVTMEETFGLYRQHQEFFYAVIKQFTTAGYSVRHRIINCSEYGVPQTRRRLVLFASAPGEALPPFPSPTHGLNSQSRTRRPLNTIKSFISRIPATATLHDKSRSHFRLPRAPFSPDRLASTMTCDGGKGNYHPSGNRHYTPREFACLQTFPVDYQFCEEDGDVAGITKAKKQIGNAVPPLLAKTMFRAVVKSLKKTDGVE
ncbi:MAG: hypothetical protein Q9160_000352 [Pyrenula sp. 1 TL-2023]